MMVIQLSTTLSRTVDNRAAATFPDVKNELSSDPPWIAKKRSKKLFKINAIQLSTPKGELPLDSYSSVRGCGAVDRPCIFCGAIPISKPRTRPALFNLWRTMMAASHEGVSAKQCPALNTWVSTRIATTIWTGSNKARCGKACKGPPILWAAIGFLHALGAPESMYPRLVTCVNYH